MGELVQQTHLTFSQKYGLKFYSFLLSQSLVLWLLFVLKSPNLSVLFVPFYTVIGNYLPISAKDDKNLSQTQNKNRFLLGPLIANCISTPIILYIMWTNYETLVEGSALDVMRRFLALTLIVSMSIDASHELLHRPEQISKFFSYFNLFFLQFTIYPTEHLFLHHKKVGTTEDPITSPKNRNFYFYYLKAIVGCYKFNYNYSKKVFFFNISCTIGYNIVLVLLALREGSSIWKAFGLSIFSYLCIYIMEVIEYIEHYGLVYRKDDKEKNVEEICSWNSTENEFLNWFVFRFQRHSDHHMNAYKIYPTLDLTPKMPLFPFNFVDGVLMATFPPLWYAVMNPLVDEVIEGKKASDEHHKFVSRVVKTVHGIIVVSFMSGVICEIMF